MTSTNDCQPGHSQNPQELLTGPLLPRVSLLKWSGCNEDAAGPVGAPTTELCREERKWLALIPFGMRRCTKALEATVKKQSFS